MKPLRTFPMAGFTMIELMIVVAIVTILASIALPAYQDYIRRSQVSEAFAELSSLQTSMEQYYQDNRSYANGGACGIAMPSSATGAVKYFTYACAITAAGGYLITATGSAGNATGNAYTVDDSNTKQTTSFKGKTVAKSCWLVKGDEC